MTLCQTLECWETCVQPTTERLGRYTHIHRQTQTQVQTQAQTQTETETETQKKETECEGGGMEERDKEGCNDY